MHILKYKKKQKKNKKNNKTHWHPSNSLINSPLVLGHFHQVHSSYHPIPSLITYQLLYMHINLYVHTYIRTYLIIFLRLRTQGSPSGLSRHWGTKKHLFRHRPFPAELRRCLRARRLGQRPLTRRGYNCQSVHLFDVGTANGRFLTVRNSQSRNSHGGNGEFGRLTGLLDDGAAESPNPLLLLFQGGSLEMELVVSSG